MKPQLAIPRIVRRCWRFFIVLLNERRRKYKEREGGEGGREGGRRRGRGRGVREGGGSLYERNVQIFFPV